jgi:phosphoribosylamine--glycine ligase
MNCLGTGVDQAVSDMKLTAFHSGTTLIYSSGKLVTSGGRILTLVATDTDFAKAAQLAVWGALVIQYEGKVFRRDIAQSAVKR